MEEFTGYVIDERGLAEQTVSSYRGIAMLFLRACACDPGGHRLMSGDLAADDVIGFVLAEAYRLSVPFPQRWVTQQRCDRATGPAAALVRPGLHGHVVGVGCAHRSWLA